MKTINSFNLHGHHNHNNKNCYLIDRIFWYIKLEYHAFHKMTTLGVSIDLCSLFFYTLQPVISLSSAMTCCCRLLCYLNDSNFFQSRDEKKYAF